MSSSFRFVLPKEFNPVISSDKLSTNKKAQKVYEIPDKEQANYSSFLVVDEDHTFGCAMQKLLCNSPGILAAGYIEEHPSFNYIRISIKTDGSKTPKQAFIDACNQIVYTFKDIEKLFANFFNSSQSQQHI